LERPKSAIKITALEPMTSIVITMGAVTVLAELNDSETARSIAAGLPLRARANTWGKEIYFRIDVAMPRENAVEVVAAGELGYWPDGQAFCIFFGPTPASHGDEIRAASPVNRVGRVRGEFDRLGEVRDGDAVTVDRE
jgi:hypothetical protein